MTGSITSQVKIDHMRVWTNHVAYIDQGKSLGHSLMADGLVLSYQFRFPHRGSLDPFLSQFTSQICHFQDSSSTVQGMVIMDLNSGDFQGFVFRCLHVLFWNVKSRLISFSLDLYFSCNFFIFRLHILSKFMLDLCFRNWIGIESISHECKSSSYLQTYLILGLACKLFPPIRLYFEGYSLQTFLNLYTISYPLVYSFDYLYFYKVSIQFAELI